MIVKYIHGIKSSRGVTGFVASKKGANWIKVLEVNNDNTPPITVVDEEKKEDKKEEVKETEKKLIFTCDKEDYYYIKLYPGEKLYLEK